MMRQVDTLKIAGGKIPVIVHRASDEGPVVAVTANIHGDEATGVGVVHALDAWLPQAQQAGTLVLYPTLNPGGLTSRTRVTPDGDDLNRLFPGRQRGSNAERQARTIWSDIENRGVDLLIDLHADSARSIPYAIVDRALRQHKGEGLSPKVEAHAHRTGLTVLREYPDDQYQRFALDRSLAGAMVNRSAVVALTIEAGPRRWLCGASVQAAYDATRSVLAGIELVDFDPVVHPSRVQGGPWRRCPTPRVRRAGVFRESLAPGQEFHKGDELGVVTGLTGEVHERLVAPSAGIVISWAEISWAEAGSIVGTLGVVE